jgi:dTDP-4-dehydrorhamnose reductase
MRILITGKSGQLGKSIYKLVTNTEQTDDFVFVGREELDLSKEESIVIYFDSNDRFDIIINCAAYTAVDKAEEELELANQVNHLAVQQLSEIASKQKAKLIHISTDYVFDGESDKSYIETDETSPINVYGKTKLAGEQALKEIMPIDAIIIRTSWVYSEYGNNFVDTMLRLGKERDELNVVGDQIGSPTYATDLAKVIIHIVQSVEFNSANQETQTYHYSNKGEISWYEFAKEIFKKAKIKCKVNSITTDEYPTSAKRPRDTTLDKSKIARMFNINILDWNRSLDSCIALLKKEN